MSVRVRLSLAGLLLFLAAGAAAEPPPLVQFQGVLLAPDGSPRSGPVDLELRIFALPSGGSPLYAETHAAVPLVDGVFSVSLGGGNPISGTPPFSPALLTGPGTRWLEVTAGGESLKPRQQLLSVPYALESATVGGRTVSQITAVPSPAAGYQRVEAASTGAVIDAACPVGKVVVGGGCECPGSTRESAPIPGSNAWHCECGAAGSTNRAYALCVDGSGGICGDGIRDPQEQCDSSHVAACPDARCGNDCRCSCGNGVLDPAEQCDVGNTTGCPLGLCSRCQCTCGNGAIDPGESCDGAAANACLFGICAGGCVCRCGNGACEAYDAQRETAGNCAQDCRLAYSPCSTSSQCETGVCLSGVCTHWCNASGGCTSPPPLGYAVTCPVDRCRVQCEPPAPPGTVWTCPNGLVCEDPLAGGFCAAP